jgi:DNA-binding response OmpR family regulator
MPNLMELVSEFLAEQGLKVIVASCMSAAKVAAVKYRPSVVFFLNLRQYRAELPDFIAKLPATPTAKRAPVIILSAYYFWEERMADVMPWFIPGYDAFLPKPMELGFLMECVRSTIRKA